MATKARLWPDTPTHPGEILMDEIEARTLPPGSVQVALGLSLEDFDAMLKGTKPVTAAIAWDLERVFGDISARFWMGLQADFDLATERLARAGT